MRVLLSVGEASGDVAGAALAAALREHEPGLELWGLGGRWMAAAGVELTTATTHLGTVGISEAFAALPAFARAAAALGRRVRERPPDAAVVIGNDVFNVLLGRWLRARSVPVIAFFPPQVWIWGSLARPIAASYDAILACFPQEREVYGRAARGGRPAVHFVGHYLADLLRPRTPAERLAARRRLAVPETATVVALLPGSRRHEIEVIAPALLGAARQLVEDGRQPTLLLPVADPALDAQVAAAVAAAGLAGRITTTTASHDVLRAADLALLASGTASLEAALIGVPMVVAYRIARLTRLVVDASIGLRLIPGDTIALPNLMLGRPVVPEVKQSRLRAPAVADEARRLLDDATLREAQVAALAAVREQVATGDSVVRAAELVLDLARGGHRTTSREPGPPVAAEPSGRPAA